MTTKVTNNEGMESVDTTISVLMQTIKEKAENEMAKLEEAKTVLQQGKRLVDLTSYFTKGLHDVSALNAITEEIDGLAHAELQERMKTYGFELEPMYSEDEERDVRDYGAFEISDPSVQIQQYRNRSRNRVGFISLCEPVLKVNWEYFCAKRGDGPSTLDEIANVLHYFRQFETDFSDIGLKVKL